MGAGTREQAGAVGRTGNGTPGLCLSQHRQGKVFGFPLIAIATIGLLGEWRGNEEYEMRPPAASCTPVRTLGYQGKPWRGGTRS